MGGSPGKLRGSQVQQMRQQLGAQLRGGEVAAPACQKLHFRATTGADACIVEVTRGCMCACLLLCVICCCRDVHGSMPMAGLGRGMNCASSGAWHPLSTVKKA